MQPTTHAERRAAALEALTSATVQSLVDHGIAGTTTRGVSEAAGVSQGALQHYFPNKVRLVEAALSTTLVASLDEMLADLPTGTSRERAAAVVDRLWDFHRLPVFGAVFELLSLAQRDPAAAARTAATLEVLVARIESAAASVLPSAPHDPALASRVRLAIAAVRGCAAVEGIPRSAGGSDWPAVRGEVIDLLARSGT